MSATNINIIIADDHEIFRDGLALNFGKGTGIELVAGAANGKELIALAKQYGPDVILSDIRMPVLNGIEATRQIKIDMPHIPVIALTMYEDYQSIVEMLRAGASGYLIKSAQKSEIREAIRAVHDKRHYYCSSTTPKLAEIIAADGFVPGHTKNIKPFTGLEMQLIHYICKEYTTKQIAAAMKMSVRTLEGYRQHLLFKMDVKNSAGLIVYAMRYELYKPGELGYDEPATLSKKINSSPKK